MTEEYKKRLLELAEEHKKCDVATAYLAKESERTRIIEIVEEMLEEAKTKKRATTFQNRLFNYEVDVLSELLTKIKTNE